jgi:hypothetical protein
VRRLLRRGRVPADVLARAELPGRRVLAHANATDGTWLLGTREALVVVEPLDKLGNRPLDKLGNQPLDKLGNRPLDKLGNRPAGRIRLAWEDVETADWDRDGDRLRVAEVGTFGETRRVHVFTVPEPGLLLQLIRERVTASVLLQRRVVVTGKRGLMVVARRPPTGRGEITWAYEFDDNVDPDDPAVREAAERGLRSAQDELGAGPQPI